MMLELVQNKVNEMLKKSGNENIYTDDWSWSGEAVQFVIEEFKGMKNGMPNVTEYGPYRFIYDVWDVFERSLEEQVNDWVEELSYRFN